MNLQDVSFVIPTKREKIHTLSCIPPSVSVYVERGGKNQYEASNTGISKVKTPIVALVDDDVIFTREWLDMVLLILKPGYMVGIDDYCPYHWTINRFVLFYKADYDKVGPFRTDKGWYGAPDTEWAIRMEKAGIRIIRIPRSTIRHLDTEKKIPYSTQIKDMLWLLKVQPTAMVPVVLQLIIDKIRGKPCYEKAKEEDRYEPQ